MFFTKPSILLLFLRIFFPPHPHRRKSKLLYTIWGVILFNLLYCIALVPLVLLQCAGHKKHHGGECVNEYFILVTASLINVLFEVAMAIVPLVAIWDLHMSRQQKLRVSAVFAVGLMQVFPILFPKSLSPFHLPQIKPGEAADAK